MNGCFALPAIIISSVSNTTSIGERKIMFYSKSRKLWMEMVDGKRYTGKTRDSLKKKLQDLEAEKHRGVSFEDAADAYEVSLEKKVEDTTAQSYAPHIRRAKEFFDGRYIKDITPDEVQAYVDYLVSQDYAKDTVRRALVIVNKIFKYAITQPGSEIRFNPCAAVEIPRGLKQTQREPPAPEQVVKVTPDSEIGLFAFFLLCTGLRPGELLALRWEDIDRKEKTITINKAATYADNKAVVKNRTKTSAGMRIVPLLDVLDAALPKNGTGYVFGGKSPYNKQTFYREWTRWCESAGLADITYEEHINPNNKHKYTKKIVKPLVTPYQFRHEFASILEDEGVTDFDAQHIMGHSSIKITKDMYTKFREKKNKQLDAKTKLNARFNGSAQNSAPNAESPCD